MFIVIYTQADAIVICHMQLLSTHKTLTLQQAGPAAPQYMLPPGVYGGNTGSSSSSMRSGVDRQYSVGSGSAAGNSFTYADFDFSDDTHDTSDMSFKATGKLQVSATVL
jgi:hypothetical protein